MSMSNFSQWPSDHIGSAGEFYQNCPCYQCRAWIKQMNDNLNAQIRCKPQHLWTEQERHYAETKQIK